MRSPGESSLPVGEPAGPVTPYAGYDTSLVAFIFLCSLQQTTTACRAAAPRHTQHYPCSRAVYTGRVHCSRTVITPTARRSYASAVKIRKKIPLALNVHEMAIRLRRNSNVMLETRHSVFILSLLLAYIMQSWRQSLLLLSQLIMIQQLRRVLVSESWHEY